MKKLRYITPLAAAVFLCASIPFTANANCGQNAYIASMCPFTGNFAPRGTAFANGQLLAISQNDALFSLVGTIYGGDGRTNFALPDMRGRVAIHRGQGPGLRNYNIGAKGGAEEVFLNSTQLGSHIHTATTLVEVTLDNEALNTDSSAALMGSNTVADTAAPAGNSLAQLAGRRARMYSNTAPDVVMSNDAAALTDVVDSTMQVTTTVGAIGGSRSHENRQPYLAVNWIITLFGIYPSRS